MWVILHCKESITRLTNHFENFFGPIAATDGYNLEIYSCIIIDIDANHLILSTKRSLIN
jgi:hypothetical protein